MSNRRKAGNSLLQLLTWPDIHIVMTRHAARATSANEIGIVALALAHYSLDHGHFPDELANLAPEYVAEAPLDPILEMPFQYTVDDDGLMLASTWTDPDGEFDPMTLGDAELVLRWPVSDN